MFIGHIDNGRTYPFEVWVNGGEQPRGLGAIAKTLSMDMRADDRQWLDMKLAALEKASGDDAFDMPMPPSGEKVRVPSLVAGFAKLVRYRCNELGAFAADAAASTPVVDALIGLKEPKAGTDGTLSWTVDVVNHNTGDDFVLFLKELVMPDGQRRPYSMWLSGEYPRTLDGLCKALSLDMRVLRSRVDRDEAAQAVELRRDQRLVHGPASRLGQVANVAVDHRLPRTADDPSLRDARHPRPKRAIRSAHVGILAVPGAERASSGELKPLAGRKCPECGNKTVIRKDGCDFCTACGHTGACG